MMAASLYIVGVTWEQVTLTKTSHAHTVWITLGTLHCSTVSCNMGLRTSLGTLQGCRDYISSNRFFVFVLSLNQPFEIHSNVPTWDLTL